MRVFFHTFFRLWGISGSKEERRVESWEVRFSAACTRRSMYVFVSFWREARTELSVCLLVVQEEEEGSIQLGSRKSKVVVLMGPSDCCWAALSSLALQ